MLKVKHLTLFKPKIEKRRGFLPRLQNNRARFFCNLVSRFSMILTKIWFSIECKWVYGASPNINWIMVILSPQPLENWTFWIFFILKDDDVYFHKITAAWIWGNSFIVKNIGFLHNMLPSPYWVTRSQWVNAGSVSLPWRFKGLNVNGLNFLRSHPFFNRAVVQSRYPDSKVMGGRWDPPGSCRPQIGPRLAPWTLISG